MSDATDTEVGVVLSLWRYPVKSMIGEGKEPLRCWAMGSAFACTPCWTAPMPGGRAAQNKEFDRYSYSDVFVN